MFLQTPVLSALLLLSCSTVSALAAEPGSKPGDSHQPPSAQTPQLAPPAPPSRIDPGIQKEPATIPDPKAVVPPPVVDPKMSIDPEKKPLSGDGMPAPNQGTQPAPSK
jgi:hypothetical protein